MRDIINVVLVIVFAAGFVIAAIPSFQDFGLHWALFVKSLGMYLPGLGMMLGSGIALACLDAKKN